MRGKKLDRKEKKADVQNYYHETSCAEAVVIFDINVHGLFSICAEKLLFSH